jgi:uncharacterized protein (TIGR03437 family)
MTMRIAKWRAISILPILFAAAADAQMPPNWTEQSPQTSPPVRTAFAMAYDSGHGKVVLFGGAGSTMVDLNLGDTWVWDGSTWTQESPMTSPPAENSHAMAYDSLHGQVVLFGRDGLWLWDGSNWTQPSPKTSPGPRFGCAMAYDSKRMQVVLFGGQDEITNQYLGDTWVWDGFNWSQISPANSPRPRAQHTLAYDSANQQVVLFGGTGNFQNHVAANDTWTWDGSNWTEQFPTSIPPLRYAHAMVYDSAQSHSVMFGGFDEQLNSYDDTWVWDGSNWTEELPQTSPPSRAYHSMAYDSAHGLAVLFGGENFLGGPNSMSQQYFSDTWTWGVPVVVPPPEPTINAVVDGASFAGGGVAPGEIATIFGTDLTSSSGINLTSGLPLPTAFQKVAVMVNGSPAPLFAVDNVNGQQQINFQVPFEVSRTTVNIAVVNNTSTGPTAAVPVLAAHPGIFNYTAGGLVFGAILHANFQLVDTADPAVAGETVLIYCTGLGAVSLPPADGAAGNGQATRAQPIVTIGGTNAAVSFSGLAPDFVGLYQVNAQIPAGLTSGNQSVTIAMGSSSSNSVLLPVH